MSVERECPGAPEAPEGPLRDAAVARIVTRHSSEYVLRALQLLIEQHGDIRTGLVAQAINTANTAHLDVLSEEASRVVRPDGVIPDAARRPIGIARLAESAGLPFESTRRIVQRLVDAGDCVRMDRGVIVPSAAVELPGVVRAVVANAAYVRKLSRDLETVGLIGPAQSAPSLAADDATQALAVARRLARPSAAYLLRTVGLLAEMYGDIRTGVLAQTIVVANTAHLDTRKGEGWRYAGVDQNPPDALRRPISVGRLADSLGGSFETKRRHAQRLIDDGICIRVPGGLIVPGAVLEAPKAVSAMLANVGYVRRFVGDLRVIGL
jgi:DNA-binding Lrp family transcriptional regulator